MRFYKKMVSVCAAVALSTSITVSYTHLVLSYKDKLKDMNELVDLLGMESAERGTDATGVAYSILGNMKINKSAVSAYKFNPNIPKFVNTVIGHTRPVSSKHLL